MKLLLVLVGILSLPSIALAGLVVEDDAATPGVAAAQIAPIKIEIVKKEEWTAASGSTFRTELTSWATKAGWKVVFDTTTDFLLQGDLRFEGRFDEAAAGFVRLYEKSPKPLLVDISMSQKLVYISNRNAQ